MRLQSGDFAALFIQVVDGAEGVAHNLRDARKAAGNAALRHFHQRGLGRVQDLERPFALVGSAGNRVRADAHQLPQQRLVLDDADILFNRYAARQTLSERREIRHAADRFNLFAACQFVRERNDVNGASGINQLRHARVNAAVRIQREIFGANFLRRLVEGEVVEQDCAKNRPLGVKIRRQSAFQGEVRGGSHSVVPQALSVRRSSGEMPCGYPR